MGAPICRALQTVFGGAPTGKLPCVWQAVFSECGAAVVWVSHDPGQPGRVGGRVLDLPSGRESAVAREKV